MADENQPETGITATPPPSEPAEAAEQAITLPGGAGAPVTDAARSVPLAPPDDDLTPPAWLVKADWLLLGLVAVLGFLLASVPAFNSDVFMQLATGRMIAHGEASFGADPFSYATQAGVDREEVVWVNHSWLFALGLYLLYTAVGGAGVVIAKALLAVALLIVLMQVRTPGANLFVVAVCLALGVLTLGTRLLLQPAIVSYLFLGVTLYVLNRAGAFAPALAPVLAPTPEADTDQRDRRVLWALPALFVLWVNLDNWFVLGPITVGLCWLGLALQRWRGLGGRIALGQLGAVFGVGLLACLINPFHVRAFQLPPELAYLVVRGADTVGVPLPDALVAGGRTLFTLHAFEPNLPVTASPLSRIFYLNPNIGYNVAGLCFFPLLTLGLISFLLNGLAALKPGGPPPQGARFAVWLFFAVFAVLLYRCIPFFAVVAAPITAMNLQELLAWYVQPGPAGAPTTPWVAPARLARLMSVPLLIVLLLLAWPGWLNGPSDIGSFRHVAWDIPEDASMRKATERLAELTREAKDANRAVHVFNTGPEVAHYSAWFAPGARCFLDGRYNLFARTARDYAEARQALANKSKPASTWLTVFKRYAIDQVGVESFLASPSPQTWWEEADRWLPRFADRNVALFTWSRGTHPWPGDALLQRWNTLAFGAVAPERRPPAKGVPWPEEPRGYFDRYLYPPTAMPQQTADMDLKAAYSQFIGQRVMGLGRLILPPPTYGLVSLPLAPGGAANPFALASTIHMVKLLDAHNKTFYGLTDMFPPAAPILMARSAWQAVAAAPENERCYLFLANAFTRVQRGEDFWANPTGRGPSTLRDALRRVQVVSALRTAGDIGFTDPRMQFQVHKDLGDLFLDRYYLDAAVEQMNLTAQILDALQPDDPRLRDAFRKERTKLDSQRKQIATEVETRKRDFSLKAAALKPLQKVRLALHGSYSRFTGDNKETFDPRGWGLPSMALQLLNDVDPKALTAQEQLEWIRTTLDLLYNTGQARQAAEILQGWKEPLGPGAFQYEIFRAGTEGNYDDLRATLAQWEGLLASQAIAGFRAAYSTGLMAPPGALGQTYFMLGLTLPRPNFNWVEAVQTWGLSANEYFNMKALRGIVALEYGDTADAQRIFHELLRESGSGTTVYFADLPIVLRYTTFLDQYQKR